MGKCHLDIQLKTRKVKMPCDGPDCFYCYSYQEHVAYIPRKVCNCKYLLDSGHWRWVSCGVHGEVTNERSKKNR